MDGITHPNTGHVLRTCQQYIYTDDAAAEIAPLVPETAVSTEELDTRVLAYLRENEPYGRGWDNLASRLKSPDTHTQTAFDTLDAQEQECLRLRVLEGYSIPDIASIYALSEKKAQAVLKAARANFWKTFVTVELGTLRTCRQLIYSDTGAINTTIIICSKGYDIHPSDELRSPVLAYLAANQPYAAGWDNLAVRLKSPDTHSEKAFDTLNSQAQECLRLRVLDGYSIAEIATTCSLSKKKVEILLKAARRDFWEIIVASEAQTLRTCRQFIYSDADAEDTTITICSKNTDPLSSEASRADVLAYLRANKLSWENWDTLAVHLRGLDDKTLDTTVQEAFDTLEESEIAFLRSRVGDGHTLQATAKEFDCTEAEVEASFDTYRAKFWGALAKADPTVLRECRRLIYDDADAETIATDIHKHGGTAGNVREHVYNYLVNRWDPEPGWDNPAFTKFIKAVTNQTDEKIPGFEAAKRVYNRLDYLEQDLLKYKVVEGSADEEIAAVFMKPPKQVEKDAASAKNTFWKLFTRERWSTLTYFIEELWKENELSSDETLKVEAERDAAERAHDSLDEVDQEILKNRCVHGLSIKEIAAKTDTLAAEIADILIAARDDFYDEFLAIIYYLWTPGVSEATVEKVQTDEDDFHNAWEKLQEQRYKIVPKNFRGWLKTTAERSEFDTLKADERHGRITEEQGSIIHSDEEGKFVSILSADGEPLSPDEELIKKEMEERELAASEAETKRWHELLKKTSTAILKSKKPEKKLFLLTNYFFQPKLNELEKAKGRRAPEFQDYGEALAMAHVSNRHESKVTQAWAGEPIDETDRTIRRYAAEIIPLIKKYAAEIGISSAELAKGCEPIKAEDAEKK